MFSMLVLVGAGMQLMFARFALTKILGVNYCPLGGGLPLSGGNMGFDCRLDQAVV